MKIHEYNEMMKWLTRPAPDPIINRPSFKPGGLVEPGVVYYGRKKPLNPDQQAKIKVQFPEADFDKGRYGFKVDSPMEQRAKRFFKLGYKLSLVDPLTDKQIADVKERFKNEVPEKDWNFKTKDNPKGFKYGLAEVGGKGKYATMGKRIQGYLEGKTWFDRFAPGLNADSRNYLLTSFERVAEHEDKNKVKNKTYKRIKNKDGKIIGFIDNTPTGKGTKYYMAGHTAKDGASIMKHPGYAKGAEITRYIENTKNIKIGGAKFNDLISETMKTKPGGWRAHPWERHHIYGTAKTGFGGLPGEMMLLTRDQNRAVEGVRKAFYRSADSRYGAPISFEEADKRLKKIGAALDLDGRLAGTRVSAEETIKKAAQVAKIDNKQLKTLMSDLRQGTVNFAKKIEGTEIARKICSAKANGGVAGCLNLAKKNPAKFMSRAIALGLAGELAAELAFAAPGYAAGKTGSELLGESIFGIFGAGTTFNEELAKYADPKAKELIDLQEDIAQLEKQASVIGASEAGLEGETELQERMMPGYLKGAESAVERLPIFEDPATTAAYSKAMEKYLAAQKERAKSLPRKAVSKVVEAIKTPFIEGIKDVGQSPGLFKSGGKVGYDNYLPDIDDDK